MKPSLLPLMLLYGVIPDVASTGTITVASTDIYSFTSYIDQLYTSSHYIEKTTTTSLYIDKVKEFSLER